MPLGPAAADRAGELHEPTRREFDAREFLAQRDHLDRGSFRQPSSERGELILALELAEALLPAAGIEGEHGAAGLPHPRGADVHVAALGPARRLELDDADPPAVI